MAVLTMLTQRSINTFKGRPSALTSDPTTTSAGSVISQGKIIFIFLKRSTIYATDQIYKV